MNLRKNNIQKLSQQEFDVLILGGGINGAVSASALTSMGARVALIDKNDFASYTSQESSNLVWGGIKYLETMELGLVSKLCKARNHLITNYPANVKEIRFYTTITRGFRFNRVFLYFGALFYWFMGKFFTKAPRLLSRKDINKEEPIINTDNATGGFEYSDAFLIDNDARFVFRFIRAAIDHGGIMANYVEAGHSSKKDNLWHTEATDIISGNKFSIRSRAVINACGPFVDLVNSESKIKTDHRHLFSKGIHLLVNRVTPHRRVLTFFADDGRLFFVIPMGNKSCIGTTDTRVENLPAVITSEDRSFVLENINKRLRLDRPLVATDIIAERCGVRPLVVTGQIQKTGRKKDRGDWTSLSRKHEIDIDYKNRHISIFGGKLTDCLNVGEEIADAIQKMGLELPHRNIRWYGEPQEVVRSEFFHQADLMQLDRLTASESSEHISKRLWRRYGAGAFSLLEDIREDPAMGDVLIKGTEYLRCELYHAAKREMITRLEDFLRRRSKIALIESPTTIKTAPGLHEACEILFGEDANLKIKEYFAEHPL